MRYKCMKNNNFWLKLDQLVAACPLRIDRPKGSSHPRYPSFCYPFDYGYLENTQAGDGAGIDVWAGSLPERSVSAIICTEADYLLVSPFPKRSIRCSISVIISRTATMSVSLRWLASSFSKGSSFG